MERSAKELFLNFMIVLITVLLMWLLILHVILIISGSIKAYKYHRFPLLSLHPCIPPFLSPSRRCIPIPHTVAVSSGESCLPCATGPTNRCCSRASPHRPKAEQITREKARTHTGNLFSFDRETLICISTTTPSSFAYSKNGERASHRQIQFHVSTRHAQEQEQVIFSHESSLQPRSARNPVWKPQEHGLYRLSRRVSCHGPHLYTQPLSNRQSWVSTRIHFSRHPIQSAPHSVKWSTTSLHTHPYPLPNSNVPHPQCLPSAKLIRTGSLLYPAGVRGSATCHPSHHRGAAKQHPLHSPLPCPRPRARPPQQRHGCYGDGSWDNHGHECRDPADNAPARPDWRTPSNCANLQAPGDAWVQLRTAPLVEPTRHIWSPSSYATSQSYTGSHW